MNRNEIKLSSRTIPLYMTQGEKLSIKYNKTNYFKIEDVASVIQNNMQLKELDINLFDYDQSNLLTLSDLEALNNALESNNNLQKITLIHGSLGDDWQNRQISDEKRNIYKALNELIRKWGCNHESLRQWSQPNQISDNSDSAYMFLGTTRDEAYHLIKNNLNEVASVLKPAIEEALLTEAFKQYKANDKFDTDAHAYISYDIQACEINQGWPHPCVLKALADLRNLAIWIYINNEVYQEQIVPHPIHPKYETSEPKQRVNLLYTADKRFCLLSNKQIENSNNLVDSSVNQIMTGSSNQSFFNGQHLSQGSGMPRNSQASNQMLPRDEPHQLPATCTAPSAQESTTSASQEKTMPLNEEEDVNTSFDDFQQNTRNKLKQPKAANPSSSRQNGTDFDENFSRGVYGELNMYNELIEHYKDKPHYLKKYGQPLNVEHKEDRAVLSANNQPIVEIIWYNKAYQQDKSKNAKILDRDLDVFKLNKNDKVKYRAVEVKSTSEKTKNRAKFSECEVKLMAKLADEEQSSEAYRIYSVFNIPKKEEHRKADNPKLPFEKYKNPYQRYFLQCMPQNNPNSKEGNITEPEFELTLTFHRKSV